MGNVAKRKTLEHEIGSTLDEPRENRGSKSTYLKGKKYSIN